VSSVSEHRHVVLNFPMLSYTHPGQKTPHSLVKIRVDLRGSLCYHRNCQLTLLTRQNRTLSDLVQQLVCSSSHKKHQPGGVHYSNHRKYWQVHTPRPILRFDLLRNAKVILTKSIMPVNCSTGCIIHFSNLWLGNREHHLLWCRIW
jgi:hypothetical protein